MQRHMPLGYRIINGKAEIVPENAQIVIAIFQEYLSGTSTYRIAKKLAEQGVLNANHKPSWSHGSVGKILENTRYMGDEFYPALIESAMFEQVQRKRREKTKSLGRTAQLNSSTNANPWNSRLCCGICGKPYRRYVEHCRQTSKTVKWKCKHYIKENRVSCRNVFLTEEQIEGAFIKMVDQVIACPGILEKHPPVKQQAFNPAIERLTGEIEEALWSGQCSVGEIKKLIFERAACQYRMAAVDDWQYQTDKIKEALREKTEQKIFDKTLVTATVKKAVIYENGRIQFTLLNGLQIETDIPEKKKKGANT